MGCGSMDAYRVHPEDGQWRFEELVRVENACSFDIVPEDAGVPGEPLRFELYQDGLQWFLSLDSEGEPGGCTQTLDRIGCAPAVEWERASDSVTVSRALVVSGTFADRDLLEGTFFYDYNCRGDGCAAFLAENELGAMPCRVEGSFRAESEVTNPFDTGL